MERIEKSKESSTMLRKALFFYLAVALLLLVLSLALTIYITLFDHLKRAENKSVVHAAQTSAMAIDEWCRRAKDLARQINSRTRLRQELEKYNQGLITIEEVRAFTEPKLQDAMDLSKDIIGIRRLDSSSNIVAACGYGSDLDLPNISDVVEKYIFHNIVLLAPLIVKDRLSIIVSAPIRNRKGERQGTDLVILDTYRLNAITNRSRPVGKTSKIFVGYHSNDAIAFLFAPKDKAIDPPSRLKSQNAVETAVSKAIAGITGIDTILDTLVVYTPVMESNWGLVITQDENELYSLLYRKMGNIGILCLLLYLLIVFGFGFVMKPLAGRVLLHTDELERKIREKTAVLEKEIDRRTEIQERLREKEQFLASVFDSIQDGISVLTSDLKIVRTNEAIKSWYASHVPMEGKSCFEVYHGRQQPCRDCPVLRAEKSGQIEMKEVPLIQGGQETGVLEVYVFPMLDDDGTVTRFVEYVRNVSQRKQAEQALADSEKRLSDIIEFLPNPTWVIDIDGKVIAWNRAIERITGIEKKDMIGKGDYAYSIPFYGERRPVLIDLMLRRDENWESKYLTLKDEDGFLIEGESYNPLMGADGRYLAASSSRLYDTQGNVVGAIEIIRDITHEKRTEQEREELIAELKDALAKVQTLSGLLPMCSKCKKIRDDSGYWNQLETYISQHTNADVSHGLCPECIDDLYGGQDWYEEGKHKSHFSFCS